jgi:hypothetical protein
VFVDRADAWQLGCDVNIRLRIKNCRELSMSMASGLEYGSIGIRAPIEAKVEHLMKTMQLLLKELDKYEKLIQILPEGVRIKSQQAEVLILNNGDVRISGQRVLLAMPGKGERLLGS